MNKFDSIRPYNDEEVNNVLINLSNNRRFLKMLFTTGKFDHIRFLPFSRKILSYMFKRQIRHNTGQNPDINYQMLDLKNWMLKSKIVAHN